jgi:hypothetical protein
MQLSSSALSVFVDCKRCFFLDRKMKAPRPRGIFPSLPGGVDGILKKRLDSFRGQLPPEFVAVPELQGWTLFDDAEKLSKWRQWNSKEALKYTDAKGNILVGGLDDVLSNGDGILAPADYKTKGSEPCQEDCEKYYKRQLDIYALLLSTRKDFQVAEFGALFYFWPIEDGDGLVKFESKTFFMDVSAARAKDLFNEALKLLAQDELPEADPGCEYCRTFSTRSEAMVKALAGGK